MIIEDKIALKKIRGQKRIIELYVNTPSLVDEFISHDEALNLLVLIQIMDEERAHRRAGLRFRRKVSKIFTQHWSNIRAEYRIICADDGNHYLRSEFYCYSDVAGKGLYERICKNLF